MKSISLSHYFFLCLILLTCVSSYAQEINPINSNYLISQGVSPRVLDFAANTALQDGRFKESIKMIVKAGEVENTYKFQSIYDPSYTDGLDIRFIVDGTETTKKDAKILSEAIRNLHHFSRLVEQYLYDESTLRLIKNENGEVVYEFYYRKVAVDPSMVYVKRLKGTIHFNEGVLDFVELTNIKPLKNGVDNYRRKVYFEQAPDVGGHFVVRVEESYEVQKGKNSADVSLEVITTEFADDNGDVKYSDDLYNYAEAYKQVDTLSVKLGGVLPLFGKPATKLGYQLPRPVGLNLLTHLQEQQLQFTGLSIGVNSGDLVSLNDLFLLDQSSLRQTTVTYMAKGDVWLFPFLNLTLIAGRAENRVDGDLVLTDEVKALLGLLGLDAPDALNIVTDAPANLLGAGLVLAAGAGNFNFTFNYQIIRANAFEFNTVTTAQTATALVGYMLPFGMNIMAGTQGQFYETGIGGSIDLDDGNTLDFLVDFEPRRWNFFGGIYKGFAKHWEITLQLGVGDRNSLTAMFGYRF